MRRRTLALLVLTLFTAHSIFSISIVSVYAEEEPAHENLSFLMEAGGNGLVVWGHLWGPPFPGEPFYWGSPEMPDPIQANLGEPLYASKLMSSDARIMGRSAIVTEEPVRPGDPVGDPDDYALPESLTKLKCFGVAGSGSLEATWTHDGQEHVIDVDFIAESTILTWAGPPATCEWGFMGTGGPNPRDLNFIAYEVTGTFDGEAVHGYCGASSWSDVIQLGFYFDNVDNGIFASFWWIPDTVISNEWLIYWLDYQVEVQNYGYGAGQDPLVTWIEPADRFIRVVDVDGIQTLSPTGEESWFDDFNDGDYDGWTITGYNFEPFYVDMMTPPIPIQGNYSAEDGTLLSLGPRVPGLAGVASHPSTVAYGTWSFDIQITEETEEHFYVYFATDDWGDYPLHINSYDIAIVLQPGQAWSWELEENAQSGFVLVKRNGAATEGGWQGLGSYSMYEELSGVYHVDVTRDHDGNFKVYIDGDLVIEATDTEHTTSTWFRFTGEPGPAIDNVVVKDTIDELANQLDKKVMTLQNEVSGLEGEKMSLENEKSELEDEKATLEDEKTTLEDEKSTLTTEKAALEGTVSTLQESVSSLEGSLGSWQMYTAAALIIGLIIGAAAIYMLKR